MLLTVCGFVALGLLAVFALVGLVFLLQVPGWWRDIREEDQHCGPECSEGHTYFGRCELTVPPRSELEQRIDLATTTQEQKGDGAAPPLRRESADRGGLEWADPESDPHGDVRRALERARPYATAATTATVVRPDPTRVVREDQEPADDELALEQLDHDDDLEELGVRP